MTLKTYLREIEIPIGLFGSKIFSPNIWTSLSVLFGLITGYLFFRGSISHGVLFLMVYAFLDWVDGAVARVCKKQTDFGSFFSSTCSNYMEILIIFSMAHLTGFGIVGLLAVSGCLLYEYLASLASGLDAKVIDFIDNGERRLLLILSGIGGILDITYLTTGLFLYAGLTHMIALMVVIHTLNQLRGR
jgi:phosphatidylglycerophosphate synthase